MKNKRYYPTYWRGWFSQKEEEDTIGEAEYDPLVLGANYYINIFNCNK